ncbi:MAG: hypothetical protein QME46_04425 [Thermoanaerobacteraceae bacterium]|nr:hypothetical protein [Thermoanaerobacteraceae bacterium]
MQPIVALTIVLVVFALGDIVSAKTKALLSMLFVSSIVFLVGFWLGLPKDLFAASQLVGIGSVLIGLLITHMGTLMSISDLIKQWKTVIIALGAVAGVGIFVLIPGSMIYGRQIAAVAAPPISGGVVAALMMSDAAKAKGLTDLAVFATMLLVAQGFIGYPLSSIFLTKEAKRIKKNKEEYQKLQFETAITRDDDKKKSFGLPPMPKEFQTSTVYLAKLSLGALVAIKLAALFNNAIHPYVWALFIGIALREIGFLEEDIFTKANSFGISMVTLLAIVMGNLSQATPQIILEYLSPLVGTLILGVIGIFIFTFILGKLLGYSFEMAATIGLTALYGFPGTYILTQEAAKAVADNEEERQLIMNEILPKMLVAGFVTVTISSVILASIFVKFI